MSLSESLKKIAAGAAEKGKDLAEQSKKAMDNAADKAKSLAEQGKLASENQKQDQVIKEAKAQIGAYVAETTCWPTMNSCWARCPSSLPLRKCRRRTTPASPS